VNNSKFSINNPTLPKSKKILVTGSAGFIGSALSIRLLDRGDTVIGIDNHNDYYDPAYLTSIFSYTNE
jgi:nucleoside-diphosphate-sugar epimerase